MKHIKFYESFSQKFTDDFVDLINYACLDLIDNHYIVDISNVVVEDFEYGEIKCLKIDIKTKGDGCFNLKIIESNLNDIKDIVSKFGFSSDINIDGNYIPMSDLKEFFPVKDTGINLFRTLSLIIY